MPNKVVQYKPTDKIRITKKVMSGTDEEAEVHHRQEREAVAAAQYGHSKQEQSFENKVIDHACLIPCLACCH
ncbi:hypothetical protein EUGRSUZ_L01099 [Eucalyptus grandis]|uniref:Uncharacterized protein n=1 Tax=Eucalyptus grandis TaxID=71139 RepID=A0A058ZV57_EUCGR|nr:hypothetical protein EUGRSUZ_L01099 [Eucalyptus grandis]